MKLIGWLALSCLLLDTGVAWGQSTFGSIVGTVLDPSGAAVPGATVIAKEIDTAVSFKAVSSREGFYEFANLKPGRYEVTAAKAGFADSTRSLVTLDARRAIRTDFDLKLERLGETVTVRETPVGINTEDGTIADTKNFAQITQLPLNYRGRGTDPTSVLFVVPGVQLDAFNQVSIGGGLPKQVEYSIDGISIVSVSSASPLTGVYPSPESLAEFKVTSVDANAEFGQMGDVSVVTRGGTNQFHGSAVWYHQNAALDAKTYGSPTKQKKVFNTFGASLGGPLTIPGLYRGKNRTFFFVDFEGNRQPASTLFQTSVPTVAMRQGNLAGVPGAAALDPLNGQPFPDNVIPKARLNSVANNLFKAYYPLPNYDSGSTLINYRVQAPIDSNVDGYDVRVDHVIGSRQQVFARLSRRGDAYPSYPSLLPTSQLQDRNRNLVISHNFALRPNLVNELRFGITRSSSSEQFPIIGADAVATLGIQGLDLSQVGKGGGFPYFSLGDDSGFGSLGHGREFNVASKSIQLTDNLTWTKGRHTWKFGLDIRHLSYQESLQFDNEEFGLFVFKPDAFSGNSFADLLLGLPAQTYVGVVGPNLEERTNHLHFYGQDQWRLSRRLTLTFGLRWQVHTPMTADGGGITNFDPATGNVIVPDQTTPPAPGFLNSINLCPGKTAALPCTKIVNASSLGLGPGLRKTRYDNWTPRVGFAYRPFRGNRTVLRGGAGIYTQTILGFVGDVLTGIHTSDVRRYDNYQEPGVPPVFTLPQAFGGQLAFETPGNVLFNRAINLDYRDPRSYQWNVTLEQQLHSNLTLRLSYVGVQSVGLTNTVDLNQVPASTVPFSRSRVPYPVFSQALSLENTGFANYQGLQTELSRRFHQGLFFQAGYTLAKNIGNAGGPTGGLGAGPNFWSEYMPRSVMDRFNTGLDRGDLSGSRRHRFVASGIFQLPVGRGRLIGRQLHGLAELLAGGWDLSTIALVESGPLQTAIASNFPDRSNTNSGSRLIRPDRIGDGNLANPTREMFYDRTAFVQTPAGAGRFGNSGVGILRGPHTVTFAAGLSKTYQIRDNFKLRMEGTFTNLANHPNFQAPVVNLSNLRFGRLDQILSAENAGNRKGQVGMRIDF